MAGMVKKKKKIKEKTFMIVGDPNCGKTSLIEVMECNVNPELPTVYFKFISAEKTRPKYRKKTKKVLLSLWDTPAENWHETREAIYPHLDSAIIVFAIDDPASLRNVKDKWYPQLRQLCPKKIPVILVGNKTDTRDNPQPAVNTVSYEEGMATAEEIKAYAYVECSALNKNGTLNVFTFAIQSVIKKSRCRIL